MYFNAMENMQSMRNILYSQNVKKGRDQAKYLRNYYACLKTPAYKENHKDEKNIFCLNFETSKIDNKHT